MQQPRPLESSSVVGNMESNACLVWIPCPQTYSGRTSCGIVFVQVEKSFLRAEPWVLNSRFLTKLESSRPNVCGGVESGEVCTDSIYTFGLIFWQVTILVFVELFIHTSRIISHFSASNFSLYLCET